MPESLPDTKKFKKLKTKTLRQQVEDLAAKHGLRVVSEHKTLDGDAVVFDLCHPYGLVVVHQLRATQ